MALTVTVTPAQLMLGVFAEKLAATLSATNFPGRRLQLCVDTDRLPPVDDLATAVARIKRSGVAVALRDFTLTLATASYVRPGIADNIHLSRGLVAGVDTDTARSALLETTVAVARAAGWSVTVPFVARKEEATKLLRLGCRQFQGPLFAPPMPIAALTALILNPAAKQAS
jgi:EAL domain-containing protein (putative c-di-GMP-specific phosphodiesterase class I)